jgi:hypothetical protein
VLLMKFSTGLQQTQDQVVLSIAREEYTTHGLHLNSRGKKSLMHLIAERVVDGHAPSVSSIPVITHARASPFLA